MEFVITLAPWMFVPALFTILELGLTVKLVAFEDEPEALGYMFVVWLFTVGPAVLTGLMK